MRASSLRGLPLRSSRRRLVKVNSGLTSVIRFSLSDSDCKAVGRSRPAKLWIRPGKILREVRESTSKADFFGGYHLPPTVGPGAWMPRTAYPTLPLYVALRQLVPLSSRGLLGGPDPAATGGVDREEVAKAFADWILRSPPADLGIPPAIEPASPA